MLLVLVEVNVFLLQVVDLDKPLLHGVRDEASVTLFKEVTSADEDVLVLVASELLTKLEGDFSAGGGLGAHDGVAGDEDPILDGFAEFLLEVELFILAEELAASLDGGRVGDEAQHFLCFAPVLVFPLGHYAFPFHEHASRIPALILCNKGAN